MARDARAERTGRLLAPRLHADEDIVAVGAAWFARVRHDHLLFVGRHYRLVALTDQRLLVFNRRARRARARGAALLDVALDRLHLVRAGAPRLLYPVLLDVADEPRALLEFRRRERALARELVAQLRAPAPTAPSGPTSAS